MPHKSLPTLFVQAALIATATVLAFTLVTKYIAPIPLSITQTTTQKDTAFNVTGKSTVTATPDKAEITVGITKKENDIKLAQSEANQVMNDLQQKLQAIGISKDDIKTQNYSISPNYDYQTPSQRLLGYSVDISLNVSVTDFTKLSQIADIATASGANQVSGVQFTLSDSKQKELTQQARSEAIADAKKNAGELSQLSGMRLGRIINVSEGTNTPGPIMYMNKTMMATGMAPAADAAPVPTNIQPGTTTYNYTITLSYETL